MSRPRTFQKSRPSSIFGSFRSSHSLYDEGENLVRTHSSPASVTDDIYGSIDVTNMIVLHYGEVQSGSGMFRKKNTYLVLTNTHLLRFKTQVKAAEAFSMIPTSWGRSNTARHSRLSSNGSLYENQAPADGCTGIPLNHVVAIYKLDDGRPYFTIEIAYLDEQSNQASTMALQLNDPRKSDLWLSSIRAAITKSRLIDPNPPPRKTTEYLARAVECECDYDPNHFRMFKVVQRATKTGGRSSTDDLTKLTSNVCYLVIGFQKVHLIPLPRSTKPASNVSLSEMGTTTHGVTCLTSVCVQNGDDAFQIAFRKPLQQSSTLYLASSCVNDIALWLRQAADFLRPTWLEQPFLWRVPQALDDSLLPIPSSDEDHLCFDRTLTAYCVGYNIDPSRIRYTVDYSCEDAPSFQLLEPSNKRQLKYTALELLAVMRALRYNESFHAITFRNIDLGSLHGLFDPFGSEHVLWTTRSGGPLKLPLKEQSWLLLQEIQSLALKSKRLRRLDFTNCLNRKPKDDDNLRDPGSGICEALFPLCGVQLTNIDWIVLNGIHLAEVDIDYLYAAAIEKRCHFRAIDLGRCNLNDQSMKTVLQGMVYQEETLESIDISGNPARINPEIVARQLGLLQRIRKLNISNTQLSAGQVPLIDCGILLKWKLEDISLVGTSLNEQSIESLVRYLADDQSSILKSLRLSKCQLTGKHASALLQAMNSGHEQPRKLHLYLSENQLELHHDLVVRAFGRSITPTHVTMQLLEYSNEQNFQNLICAMSSNRSLQYLDISRTSLPVNASPDTCHIMRHMFETNDTLEELNISGEETHLEAITLGPGLRDALKGLEKNKCLKVLRIEHQVLALPGANALASILEKNSTLREIHCENNDISLQAFTGLVNAMKLNTSLWFLPNMDRDRAGSRQRVDREVDSLREGSSVISPTSTKASMRRAFSGAITSGRTLTGRNIEKSPAIHGFTERDVQAAVASLDQRWESEVARLQRYLKRNFCLAHGLPLTDEAPASPTRPGDMAADEESIAAALQMANLDRTPKAEFDFQLGDDFDEGDLEKSAAFSSDAFATSEEYSEKLIDVEDEGEDHDGGLMMAPS